MNIEKDMIKKLKYNYFTIRLYISDKNKYNYMLDFKISENDDYAKKYDSDDEMLKLLNNIYNINNTSNNSHSRIISVMKMLTLISVNKWFVSKHENFSKAISNKIIELKKETDDIRVKNMINLFDGYIFGNENIYEDSQIIETNKYQLYPIKQNKGKKVKTVQI